ncbi:putative DNA-3-methyladenine glycosylase 2-like [Dorcoceras hygrometricum]|uniref:Putative DNA-3-methyladenine glycosylase 2-like n=1 Tax=Dorcoceras hygrometricum TaxID=472368 RepID=A0A2Z7CL13_9LAMI|nr:putative DNA-3-methyladenine glycosylase 2-like [Dorcoceras hygrometricum]
MAEQELTQMKALYNPKPEFQSQSLSLSPETQPHCIYQPVYLTSVDPHSHIPLPPPQSSPAVESTQSSPTQISHNSQNPSKIPIRPPKIRKLSASTTTGTFSEDQPSPPQTTGEDSSASSSVAISTTTTTRTNANNVKNKRRSASQASRALPQIIKPLSSDGEIELGLRHLRVADPLLAPLIDIHQPPQFESHHPPFLALTKSILYQQLAYKAGTSIYTRFVSLLGGEDGVFPDSVLALSSQQLKQIGVSSRKASYLYDLANKYKSGILSDETIVKMDDRSLFTMLSMVKGIGSWSVHMFMIFSLHRPDVLPVSDLGVRKGVQLLYGLEELPRPSRIEQLCEKWRPYRSIGAWYMWRLMDGRGAPTAGPAVFLEGNVVQPLPQIVLPHDGRQHQLQYVEPHNGIGNLG